MNKLVTGMLLIALSIFPVVAQAEGAPGLPVADKASSEPLAQPAPIDESSSEAGDYAAREAAAPELGEFEGGHYGYYIGGGAVTVVLVVLLVLVLL